MRRARASLRVAAALLTALCAEAAFGASPVGQFFVDDGPLWNTDPPTYSCVEACALLFGGAASDYRCSTSGSAIDDMAYVDGYGDGFACGTPVAGDYKLETHYDCGVQYCSYSAYVADNDCAATNYCWAKCGDGVVEAGEDCDDGNTAAGDCCDATCHFEPAQTVCNGDVDVCDGLDACDGAGSCLPGTPPVCDDGDLCTQDSCDAATGCANDPAPRLACGAPAPKASLSIDKAKQKESFSWSKGGAPLAQLGNPPEGTDTALCVYDADSLVQELFVEGSTTCDGKPCWKTTGKKAAPSGFAYEDAAGAQDGVRSLTLRAGDADKGKIALGAKGDAIGGMDLGSGLTAPLRVQVVNDYGACFEAGFDASEISVNDGSRFSARHKAK